jgi:hypothetical protein
VKSELREDTVGTQATVGNRSFRGLLEDRSRFEAADLRGQKTPPFAGAKRRGRNREEAIYIQEGNAPEFRSQEDFLEFQLLDWNLTIQMNTPQLANRQRKHCFACPVE